MFGLAVGDFKKDTRLDIDVPKFDTQHVGVFLGYGDGTFASQQTFSIGTDSGPYWVASSDLNKDNKLDIIVANSKSNNVSILLGNGNGEFAPQTTLPIGVGSGPVVLVVADVNKDNQLNIVVDNDGAENIGVFLSDGNGNFASKTTFSTGSGSKPYFIGVADINQDTVLDIVVANSGTDNMGILLGNGDGTFASQTTVSTGAGSQLYVAVVGYFNQDKLLDVVIANYGTDNLGIFLGNGDGSFASMVTFSTGSVSKPYLLATGDHNKDNRLDIFVANYGTNNTDALLGSGYGTFAPQITFSTGAGSQTDTVVVGDLNKDGRLDVVAGNYGT